MQPSATLSDLTGLLALREEYSAEMNCQIIHDSIHARPGWTQEYALNFAGAPVGYGSVAIGGPWRESPTIFEFYVQPEWRTRIFQLFESLLAACGAQKIETQTNDLLLTTMLHTYSTETQAEAILFEDFSQTTHTPAGAQLRQSTPDDVEILTKLDLDDGAKWVLAVHGEIAGAGGVLYHYNRPYGDVYMKIAEPFRQKGLGAYLVQELKSVCRRGGSIPAARCNVNNQASRRTLQNAGFVPCGNLVAGKIAAVNPSL